MPKENKVRGRREKRKREDEEPPSKKRQKSAEAEGIQFVGTDNAEEHIEEAEGGSVERPFYGLLTDEEQEYFRRADELLELNDFPSAEERSLFLANVYKEAEGKELKIANSQSCSRLMERLILLSTPEQLKTLFEKFSGNFLHLIQHRFASHCCETLFIQSAPAVTVELTGDINGALPTSDGKDGDTVYVSMENLFLYTLNELEGHMTFLLTDRFASHTLRVLLVVLSGQPLAKSSTKSLLQSRKKEKIGIAGVESGTAELSLDRRAVPDSFRFAIEKIISDTVTSLDPPFIRVLATHPTGNPSLQLLLELELTQQGKGKASASPDSVISKLLPDDIMTPDSESATFINGLIYEPIGSRLLETIVTFAPGKLFKQIYRTTFKERIGSLARNEIASFVVTKVLERLSKEDLEEATISIIPQIPGLIERSRTSIIKTLLARCHARKAKSSIEALSKAIEEAYGSDPASLLLKMTNFAPPVADSAQPTQEPRPAPDALHGSLLAQAMLAVPGSPTTLIQNSLLSLETVTLVALALTTTTSHILQAALQPDDTNLTFRRKLVNAFLAKPDSILTLALSKPGSHTLDALFAGTTGLMSLKERIATTLLQNEGALRDDYSGRVVWRNWMCDLFKRRRGEWVGKVKAGEGGAGVVVKGAGVETVATRQHRGTELDKPNLRAASGKYEKDTKGKTAIQLAREKFAANKITGLKVGRNFKATGANALSGRR
ncbi:MAG: Nucleolar protein 9 [Claussenomyces sp. TS43310]|nr:MAG: Nucleolar protein 9 [Claussenomyces sp. TS43310]